MLRLRHATRPMSLPRLLMLALLALGVLGKPVLASIGEVHELQHDPSGQHLHLDDGGRHLPVADAGRTADDPQPVPHTDASTDTDRDGLLHELLHFAHCCGQSPQSVPATAMTVPPIAVAASPPAFATAPAPRHRCQDVFRPPIAG